jgi:ABC-type sugar transport system ATPase subunit/ribose/xylose/arabinose/galactoside ABC-type transport system permease subunit
MAANRLDPALEVQDIWKAFPGVQALRGVSLTVGRGEVHAVVGENGAGKSTLMKILAGAEAPELGTLRVHGRNMEAFTPDAARREGIAIIYQEFNLISHLSVSDNISLGRERRRWLVRGTERAVARRWLSELEADILPEAEVAGLSVANRQIVEIARALSLDASILIMDEPASALSETERERLFALIGKLRARGITILYVSHSLEEVFRLADRVTVLKDGELVFSSAIADTNPDKVITGMVGRKLDHLFPPRGGAAGDVILEVRDMRSGSQVNGVTFSLRANEILGVYGLVGAGRTELCKAIFGARPSSGEVRLAGEPVHLSSPRAAVHRGVALLTEDRKEEGLILGLSIRENMALPSLGDRQVFGLVRADTEKRETSSMVADMQVKCSSVEEEVVSLSGGNQQKVVIGKWLLSHPRVLICDEPTRGVDIGARLEIYARLRELARQGMGIMMVSSELPEVLGMADRTLVMRKGRISADLPAADATEEKVMAAALGGATATGAAAAAREAPPVRRRDMLRGFARTDIVVFVSLAALFLAGIITAPSFLDSYNLTSNIRAATALGIVAMGQAMVMISGGVDLSVSATITLTMILSAGMMAGRASMIFPSVLACLGVGLAVGLLNGLAVVRLKVAPFIATLGVMSIGRGVVLIITHGAVGAIAPPFRQLSRGSVGPIPSALVVGVVIFAAAALIMNRTRYGRHLFALGGGREVARLAGVRVSRVEFTSYLMSGLCAAVAGLYLSSRTGVGDPSVGPGFDLDSIIAVLIGGIPFGGGRGNILGVIAGVLLITVLGSLVNAWNLQTWYHQIARAVVLLAAISIIKQKD